MCGYRVVLNVRLQCSHIGVQPIIAQITVLHAKPLDPASRPNPCLKKELEHARVNTQGSTIHHETGWAPKPDGLLGLLAKESKTREIKPRIHCITQQTQTHTYIQPSTTTVVSFHGEAHVYVHTQNTYIHTHTHTHTYTHTSPSINAQVIVYNTTNTNTHIYTAEYYYSCFF